MSRDAYRSVLKLKDGLETIFEDLSVLYVPVRGGTILSSNLRMVRTPILIRAGPYVSVRGGTTVSLNRRTVWTLISRWNGPYISVQGSTIVSLNIRTVGH